jgi:hypothetical protein
MEPLTVEKHRLEMVVEAMMVVEGEVEVEAVVDFHLNYLEKRRRKM